MGSQFGKLIGVDLAIQFIGWMISAKFRTEKFFDLTGSLTFILLTYLSRRSGQQTLRQKIQCSCVFIWALRLGAFLFYRILSHGKDGRFDRMRNSPSKLFQVWMMQGVWAFVTLLPTLYLNQKQVDKPLTTTDFIGWAIWLFGFAFEAIADRQKMTFKDNPNNKEKLLGLLSPIFVTSLLSFLSGIPILERQAIKTWGNDPAYSAYRSRTPVLIPFVNFPRN